MFRFLSAFVRTSTAASQAGVSQKQKLLTLPRLVFASVAFVLQFFSACAFATPPEFSSVVADKSLSFPRDFGAHPSFRTEWWYATGWLQTPDNKPLGFQITFFRSATEHDPANPSRFAPKQLILAHAALSDPAVGRLLHDQRSAREGFGLVFSREGDTDVKLDDWRLLRTVDGRYHALVKARDFTLDLALTTTQGVMLQGAQGFSRKGPQAQQASYYYSEPQLTVTGSVTRNGKPVAITGSAWLDHEWSSSMLAPDAAGWDWVGANLDDGSALMAFQIRSKSGDKLWAHATLRDASGRLTQFKPEEVRFEPVRTWRSARTNAAYPVATQIHTGPVAWRLTPLQDDQELDARQSTGAVYWEGAVTVTRDGQAAGRGYLEMTGYVKPLKL